MDQLIPDFLGALSTQKIRGTPHPAAVAEPASAPAEPAIRSGLARVRAACYPNTFAQSD